MRENKQIFHHHTRQACRIAYPVDHQVRRYRKSPKFHPSRQLRALNDVEMTTTNSEGDPIHGNEAHFDTNSSKIGVDNRYSAFIYHDINDFHGPVKKVNCSIKGFGLERTMNVYQGTIIHK